MNFKKIVHSGWLTQLHRLLSTVNKMGEGGGGEINENQGLERKT